VDRAPALEGKSMFMTLLSVHKPKPHEHRNPASKPEVAQAPVAPVTAETPSAEPAVEAAPAGE
jgi:hypothetical protein